MMCIKIAVKFIFLTFFIFINACNRSQFRTVIEMNWDIKDVSQDTYFKVLSYAYGIEDVIIESEKKKDGTLRN